MEAQGHSDPATRGHGYRVFGLGLRSHLPLPHLDPDPVPVPDVVLSSGVLAGMAPSELKDQDWFHATPEETVLRLCGLATIRVQGGREIVIDPADGADLERLLGFVLGPVFGVLLFQRGQLPIHASAVAIAGRAIAFAAPSGGGKSTLAAALCARGHRLLGDDLTLLDLAGQGVCVVSSPPFLKLSADSARLLGQDPALLERAPGRGDKRLVRMEPAPAASERYPLSRIVLLEADTPGTAGVLPPREACFALMHQFHRLHRMQLAVDPAGLLNRCARVAAAVPIERIAGWRAGGSLEQRMDQIERLAVP